MNTEKLTAADCIAALRGLYAPPAWAFLEQVGDGTGRNHSRWADAIAMNLWPSRGLELVGFEVKVSRSDWLTELAAPAKAEQVAQYCDRWFVAAPSGIVVPAELPKGWGLITIDGEESVDAERRTPVAIDRAFLAAVLRRAAQGCLDHAAVNQARQEGYRKGYEKAGGYYGECMDSFDKAMSKARRSLSDAIYSVKDFIEKAEELKTKVAGGQEGRSSE